MLRTAIPASGTKAPIIVSPPPTSEPVFLSTVARAIGNLNQNANVLHSQGQITDAGLSAIEQNLKTMANLLAARGASITSGSTAIKRPGTIMGSLDDIPGFLTKKTIGIPNWAAIGGAAAIGAYFFSRR